MILVNTSNRSTAILIIGFLILTGLVLIIYFFIVKENEIYHKNISSTKKSILQETAFTPVAEQRVNHPIIELTVKFQKAEATSDEDLEIIQVALQTYRKMYAGNPVGDNSDIFLALRGDNPNRICYFPISFPGLQDDGTVLDRWGMPWRFHALSGQHMEILSAGPDRLFYSNDDVGHFAD